MRRSDYDERNGTVNRKGRGKEEEKGVAQNAEESSVLLPSLAHRLSEAAKKASPLH